MTKQFRSNEYRFLWASFAFYFFCFLVFFVQFPLSKSFTGDLDCMGNISMFKYLECKIHSVFTGVECGSFNYPMEHTLLAYGADFGIGVLFSVFALFFEDLWANWLFISFIYASNAFGVALISYSIFKNRLAALLAGSMFSFSQFSLGGIENPNSLFFVLCFVSIYFLIRYLKQSRIRYLVYAILLGSIQIYFAPTVFVTWAIIVFVTCCYFLYIIDERKKMFVHLLVVSVLSVILISPYIYFFIVSDVLDGYYNPIGADNIMYMSLDLYDLIRVLPNNILFEQIDTTNNFIDQMKSAYLGISVWGLAIYGFYKFQNKTRVLLGILLIFGVFISMGPYVAINKVPQFPAPLYVLYEYFSFDDLYRMPVRFFFIPLLILTLLSSYGLSRIYSFPKMKFFATLILILFALENVPFSMRKYDHRYIIQDDPIFEILASKNGGELNVAHLPSTLFSGEADKYEYIYMYWQRLHHQNILNGGSAFFSNERLRNNDWMSNFRVPGNLTKLIDANQLNYIAWHQLIGGEVDLKKYDPRLILVKQSEYSSLYVVQN